MNETRGIGNGFESPEYSRYGKWNVTTYTKSEKKLKENLLKLFKKLLSNL